MPNTNVCQKNCAVSTFSDYYHPIFSKMRWGLILYFIATCGAAPRW